MWELDFRVGGGEIHSGGSPGGRHNAFRSRFHDIVAGKMLDALERFLGGERVR